MWNAQPGAIYVFIRPETTSEDQERLDYAHESEADEWWNDLLVDPDPPKKGWICAHVSYMPELWFERHLGGN